MKKFKLSITNLVFLVLLTSSFSFAQVREIMFDEEVISVSADSSDSEEFTPTSNFKNRGDFNGNLTVTVRIVSLATTAGTDEVSYRPYYFIEGEWVQGALLEFDRIPEVVSNAIINTNTSTFNVTTHSDSLFIYRTDPLSTTTIEGYPVFEKMKLKVIWNANADFYHRVSIGTY